MARVWAIAGAIIAAITLVFLLQGFVGSGTLLTMSLCVGTGAVAAYLPGGAHLSRALWLLVGVVAATLGFVLGAAAFPDTNVGLWLGAVVPVLLLALVSMGTRRQSNFLAGVLGSGALAGVYAGVFNLDPQSINISAPIAVGQTLLPLGLGYLAGMAVILVVPSDPEWEHDRLAGGDERPAPPQPRTEMEGAQ